MRLDEIIKSDCIKAMSEKNAPKLLFLRVIVGELDRIDKKKQSDQETLKILKKMKKDSSLMGNTFELEILEKYLPKMLSEEELEIIIETIIVENNISSVKEMGKIMGALKKLPEVSLIDNKIASKIIKSILTL